MRRAAPDPTPDPVPGYGPMALSPDEHCAVHHFIRRHGRRPTADELALELQGPGAGERSAAPRPALLTRMLRRDVARLVSRL
ncbi:hypothetical protein [Nocardioides sp. SYSU D00065]|uniref:hypothetical protein n=1 Tax=Nocardioides sp. SYSU D00065 TaxID=2817378 RepID=UPI001B3443E6|nr:hypothetical protein [Nocardioides sp. SYSU D00065]